MYPCPPWPAGYRSPPPRLPERRRRLSAAEILKDRVTQVNLKLSLAQSDQSKHTFSRITSIVHLITALAMATFEVAPGSFFVGEGSLEQRWPVSVNATSLAHGGSCGMWSVLYLFLRALMPRHDSRRLQAAFARLTDDDAPECLVAAALPDEGGDRFSEVSLCSGDLGRVFWFSLFKAFQACVKNRPAAPRAFLR